MATDQQTLVIAGAAEGSWYNIPGCKIDKRYCASFASATSGMSFGIFQLDCATNPGEAQTALRRMLMGAVQTAAIDQKTSDRWYIAATSVNAKVFFKRDDIPKLDAVLAMPANQKIIDDADNARAPSWERRVDGIIGDAAAYWLKKRLTAPILTAGGQDNIRLFAYLLACLNKRPDNEDTFRGWLQGAVTHTLHGPAKGFQLTAPPTLAQMHSFLSSLKIWSGHNGKYENLRSRLDPTLDALKV